MGAVPKVSMSSAFSSLVPTCCTMARGALPLLLFCLFQTGLSVMIQTQQTVKAALGKDAPLNCQLTQSKNVVQVTWQKDLPNGSENVCSYSKKSGPKVNAPFRGKVEFLSAGLQNCSIIIRKVTEQDQSCYRCLFNTFPDGALTAKTCLMVYEQYEPVLDITRSNSTEEPHASCSATGRPAPEVTLIVSERDLSSSQSNTVSVTNPNGTVTVTTTAVLSGFHGNTQVQCVVRQFSGDVMKVFKTIPENDQESAVGFGKKPGANERDSSDRAQTTAVVVVVVVVVALGIVAFYLHTWRKPRNRSLLRSSSRSDREPEEEMSPLTPTDEPEESIFWPPHLGTTPEEPQETRDPLFTHEDEQIR